LKSFEKEKLYLIKEDSWSKENETKVQMLHKTKTKILSKKTIKS